MGMGMGIDFESPMGIGVGMTMTFENGYGCGNSYTRPELGSRPSLVWVIPCLYAAHVRLAHVRF